MRARDLEGIAEHPVVADLQGADPGGRALAGLELAEHLLGPVGEGARLVELGVATRADHPGPGQRRRLVGEHRREVRAQVGEVVGIGREGGEQPARRGGELGAQAGHDRERGSEGGQLARPNLAQAEPRRGALEVAEAAEQLAERQQPRRIVEEGRDRVVALGGPAARRRAAGPTSRATAAPPSASRYGRARRPARLRRSPEESRSSSRLRTVAASSTSSPPGRRRAKPVR